MVSEGKLGRARPRLPNQVLRLERGQVLARHLFSQPNVRGQFLRGRRSVHTEKLELGKYEHNGSLFVAQILLLHEGIHSSADRPKRLLAL